MDLAVFAAVLLSAFLHAVWNAWVKSRPDAGGAVAALVIGAGAPNLIVLLQAGLPPAPAWSWIAMTVALSVTSLTLLGSAYREGDFAVAYPFTRGLIPVVLALAAVPVFGETPSVPNAVGVVCVSAGLITLGWEAARRSRTITARGLAFAALAAGLTAASVLTDAAGARITADPFSYGPTIAVLNAAVMAAVETRRRNVPRMLVRHWPITTFAALISMASYLLFIWGLMRAPVAMAVALRETSMLFAIAIAALVLRERVGPWRLAAVALMFAGAALIRL